MDFRSVLLQDHTTVRQHSITFATDDTVHTQGKELTPVSQCTWCTRSAPDSSGTHQKQGNKPEREYQELLPGTPVLVQHRQKATWEPATVVIQCAPNSYWIMQENGAEQPKVYRCTRTSLRIRSTNTNAEAKAQMKEYMPEMKNTKFQIPAIPNGNRNPTVENSQARSSSSSLPESENFSENREENSQLVGPLCTDGTMLESALDAPDTPVQRK